jgi:hypothetical protein
MHGNGKTQAGHCQGMSGVLRILQGLETPTRSVHYLFFGRLSELHLDTNPIERSTRDHKLLKK